MYLGTAEGIHNTQHKELSQDAIYAASFRDHLFVTASGNDAMDVDATVMSPPSFGLTNMISVAAVKQNERTGELEFWQNSNFGVNSTLLAAPGVQIVSTWPGNSLAFYTGTSMAAPHVAGAAALLRSATRGKLSNAEIKQILLDTAQPLDSLKERVRNGGMLDLEAAMKRALSLVTPAAGPFPASSNPSSPAASSPVADERLARISGSLVGQMAREP